MNEIKLYQATQPIVTTRPFELLLVIVNSCLERHLPHGLLFVIANSTSILHVCLNVIAMILCSA